MENWWEKDSEVDCCVPKKKTRKEDVLCGKHQKTEIMSFPLHAGHSETQPKTGHQHCPQEGQETGSSFHARGIPL